MLKADAVVNFIMRTQLVLQYGSAQSLRFDHGRTANGVR